MGTEKSIRAESFQIAGREIQVLGQGGIDIHNPAADILAVNHQGQLIKEPLISNGLNQKIPGAPLLHAYTPPCSPFRTEGLSVLKASFKPEPLHCHTGG